MTAAVLTEPEASALELLLIDGADRLDEVDDDVVRSLACRSMIDRASRGDGSWELTWVGAAAIGAPPQVRLPAHDVEDD